MVSVSEALSIILKHTQPLPAVSVRLFPVPLGLVLAEAIASDIDSPPYTKALMDGYALRADDCSSIPATLRVIEEVAAGKLPAKTVNSGEATRIMTGAPIPAGADAVVMIEKTESISPNAVRILAPVKRDQYILERGSEMKAGDVVLNPGTVLQPQDIGLLAAVGHVSVSVYPWACVGVISTGDEIVDPEEIPGPGQIRNSNGPMLLAQTARVGGHLCFHEIARDTVEDLRSLIGNGQESSDVLLLSGGVSAGKFDLIPGVLRDLGVIAHFHKVMIRPGKPLLFGTRGDKLIFGLPGNPVSSFVCFELFVRPALRKMAGHHDPDPRISKLPIRNDFRSENERPTYWPARIDKNENGWSVEALPWSGSFDLRSLHTADALLVIPPGSQVFVAGQVVQLIMLE